MSFGYAHSTAAEASTIAAVDLGSNSFHMIVAREENGQLQVIDRLREMVRLGEGLDEELRLSPQVAERALACLERFGQRLASLTPGSVAAVGTNTLRQTQDAETFLAAAERALGHPIEVIAGREEARLVYLGVAHGLAASEGRRLVIDIGGGSTELIIGEGFSPLERESMHLGCVAHSRAWFSDGVISEQSMEQAILAARVELRPVKSAFRAGRWQQAVGSSGTIRSIRDVVIAAGWSEEGISRSALKKLRKALLAAGHVEKIQLAGVSEERRPVFTGGVAVLSAIFKSLEIEHLEVSDMALREGLLYEMVGRFHQGGDVREQTVAALAQRYGSDAEQAQRVEKIALALLAQVATHWGLEGEEYATMLRWACHLHEIGIALSHSQFHRHGAYLIANSDLPGFSRRQQQILATLVRGHRRKLNHELYSELPEAIRRCVLQLTLLLRLAVLLHRGRSSTTKPQVTLTADNTTLQLHFPEGWLTDHPLTGTELQAESKRLRGVGFTLEFH